MEESSNTNNLLNFIPDFDMFSRLEPNTLVHLNRFNQFMITAQSASHIIGAQTIANYYKERTISKLIADLDNFSKKFIKLMYTELKLVLHHQESPRIVRLMCREFKLGYYGLQHIENGGMQGLLITLQDDPDIPKLKNIFTFMQINIDIIKKETDSLGKSIFDCPEFDFTDEDWRRILAIVPNLQLETTPFFKYYINYSAILTFNKLKSDGNWWDCICKFDNGAELYLGAIPTINSLGHNHLLELKDLGIEAVACLTEVFENNSLGYIYSPVLPIDWKTANIYFYHVPNPDFCTMGVDSTLKVVAFIRWNIQNGRKIYVHCKSGKSRSFLGVCAYLVIDHGYTAEGAVAYVKSKRKQAGFGKNSNKIATLKEIEELRNNKV
jgi:hypothetical protein